MKAEGASISTLFLYCFYPPIKIKAHVGRTELTGLVMKQMHRRTQSNRDVERREAATAMGWDSHRTPASIWYGAVISRCLIVRAWQHAGHIGGSSTQCMSAEKARAAFHHFKASWDAQSPWMNCLQKKKSATTCPVVCHVSTVFLPFTQSQQDKLNEDLGSCKNKRTGFGERKDGWKDSSREWTRTWSSWRCEN